MASAPEDAASLALQSIIALTLNRSDEAIQLALRAVNVDSASSLAYSALSYAQQAQFDIDQALGSAMVAVQNDVNNADALARLAELQLGVDQTSEALESARKAVSIDSQNSRARTVLGFAYLVRLDSSRAKIAFSDAIALGPGDPLPRLGLGLAVIREGLLVEGREHIEVAASLDPGNALIRSYLGKAYFEERQTADASEQFALAQRLDPKDPTAWFYDALLDQALNQPVSAYEKISRAQALNDNRLIYKSRLLVDKSASAGAISLAKIYTDLGFEELSINQSTKSIAFDPTNYSAYRLLADSYADRERHESARSNIMFQAALLQPLTITPVQPYAHESDLLILPGTNPFHPSINEYSPLFDRQGLQFAGSLVAGDERTFGNNFVLSGLHDQFAYSVGQFHYETKGYRVNNDVEHDIYHGHMQVKVLQDLFIQADFQTRETTRGDLTQNFDPNDFSPDLRIDNEDASPRIGVRWKPGSRSMLLLSGRSIDFSFNRIMSAEEGDLVAEQDTSGYEFSGRFTYGDDRLNQSVGVDLNNLDISSLVEFRPCSEEPCSFDQPAITSQYANYYYRADWYAARKLQLTLGLSYTIYEDDQQMIDESNIDPRIGIRWTPSDVDEFRVAVSRGTKRRGVADQTLEPITLAGFNQLYDNFTGSRHINIGIAYDRRIAQSTSLGLELFHREIDVPTLDSGEDGTLMPTDDSQSELTVRSYFNKILTSALSLDLTFLYERFERDDKRNSDGDPIQLFPLLIETASLPLGMRYSHKSGFFARSEISGVYQQIDQYSDLVAEADSSFDIEKVSEKFVNINLSVGFKLPKLQTTLRIDVNNLLDESFRFQGHDIQTGAISSPRYSPERLIVARADFLFR